MSTPFGNKTQVTGVYNQSCSSASAVPVHPKFLTPSVPRLPLICAHGEDEAGQARASGRIAGLVRPPSPRSSLAAHPRPLRHLGFRNHAPADPRGRGGGPLPGLHGPVSHGSFTRPGSRAGSASAVERDGVLPPCPHV